MNPGRLIPEAQFQKPNSLGAAPEQRGREGKPSVKVPEGAMTGLNVSGMTETA